MVRRFIRPAFWSPSFEPFSLATITLIQWFDSYNWKKKAVLTHLEISLFRIDVALYCDSRSKSVSFRAVSRYGMLLHMSSHMRGKIRLRERERAAQWVDHTLEREKKVPACEQMVPIPFSFLDLSFLRCYSLTPQSLSFPRPFIRVFINISAWVSPNKTEQLEKPIPALRVREGKKDKKRWI